MKRPIPGKDSVLVELGREAAPEPPNPSLVVDLEEPGTWVDRRRKAPAPEGLRARLGRLLGRGADSLK